MPGSLSDQQGLPAPNAPGRQRRSPHGRALAWPSPHGRWPVCSSAVVGSTVGSTVNYPHRCCGTTGCSSVIGHWTRICQTESECGWSLDERSAVVGPRPLHQMIRPLHAAPGAQALRWTPHFAAPPPLFNAEVWLASRSNLAPRPQSR